MQLIANYYYNRAKTLVTIPSLFSVKIEARLWKYLNSPASMQQQQQC